MQHRQRAVSRFRMGPRSRNALGFALLLLGVLLWITAAILLHDSSRPLGVVIGGVLTLAGILLVSAFR